VALRTLQPPHLRWEIEARILAGETVEVIVQDTGLHADVIKWYELWFFDVRSRLDHRAYIMHQVIGWNALGAAPDVGTVWKHYAYRSGPCVLDAIIVGSWLEHKPQKLEELVAFFREDLEARLVVKMNLSLAQIPVNQSTFAKIMDTHFRFRRMDAATRASATIPESTTPHLRELLETIRSEQKSPEKNEPIGASEFEATTAVA
jgi:hypothetical protein